MRNPPQLARKEAFYTPEITDIVEIVGGPKAGINGVIETIDKNGSPEFWQVGIAVTGIPGLIQTSAKNLALKIKGAGVPAVQEATQQERTSFEGHPFTSAIPAASEKQQKELLQFHSHSTDYTGFSALALEKLQLDLDKAINLKLIMVALGFILSAGYPGNKVAEAIAYELQKRSEIPIE